MSSFTLLGDSAWSQSASAHLVNNFTPLPTKTIGSKEPADACPCNGS